MKKRILSVLAFSMFPIAAAHADTITIGIWDAALGGGITSILSTQQSEVHVLYPDGSPANLGTFGGNLAAAVFTDKTGSVYREAAFDNLFATTSDTIRIYFSFQGVTSSTLQNTFPSIFQSTEAQPGFTVSEKIFTCANTVRFCDNYITGGGTLLGSRTFADATGTLYHTFTGTVPGSPFSIDEVFTIAYNGVGPLGDIAGAILTQPDHVAVPGPVLGAGLPGLIIGLLSLGGLGGIYRLIPAMEKQRGERHETSMCG